jgi:site-specific recombinase XerD
MFDPASVGFRGPLTPYVSGFWKELLRMGYTPLSARNLLRVAAHFSRWLEDRSLAIEKISDELVLAFLAHRSKKYTQFLTPRALRPLIGHLRELGVVLPAEPPAESRLDRFARQYAEYLARERGLSAATIGRYTAFARDFLAQRSVGTEFQWEHLKPDDLTGFVLEQARRFSVGSVKNQVSSLRSLLRYAHAEGLIANDLASCVPAVAGWRLAGLPKALEPDQVQRLLQSFDSRSAVGRRDTAIVLLLLRLGLRAGDVAMLTLEDLDWRAGEIAVCGKGRHESRLPLAADVGRALAAYLRNGRPQSRSRRVFLRCRAPHEPLTSAAVIAAARGVLKRAGIRGGAHRLRHTAATQMLRRGASLPEIGHALRHRHLDTTAIYAKVDLDRLRPLARAWPGGVA